ncbi:hypothetical protein [Rhabdochromatium marinum]|uniref:hypothetical protein n=1 Tax=Rhabdochromatium marinum TaxID=48729 RepID=UPI001905966A|nr:hypothetical protein [Rhabdochromatium marinum]MBK1647746.1 hypothetical protein [Rhabdochromatium marinum]
MALAQEDLQQIGEYVKNHISEWIAEQSLGKPPVVYEIELRERMVRVEEELKAQRELMREGFEHNRTEMNLRFEQVNKRFEQVDKHFEQVEKRFEQIDRRFEQVDKRLDLMQADMDKRFDQVDKRFDEMLKRHDTHFLWLVGFIGSGVMIIIGAMRYL